jgi:hypothetical protein
VPPLGVIHFEGQCWVCLDEDESRITRALLDHMGVLRIAQASGGTFTYRDIKMHETQCLQARKTSPKKAQGHG